MTTPVGPPTGLASAGAWNLAFKLTNQAQTLAVLIAGTLMNGLAGVGILVTATATVVLGQAIADFGLAAEVARVSVAYPSRQTLGRCYRALALHAPIALVLAPALYLALGPASGSLALLVALGVTSAALVTTAVLATLLNGLGDFRSPATSLGTLRIVTSVLAVAGAAIHPDPAVVIGVYGVGEVVGAVALGWFAHRARAGLADEDHPEGRIKRERGWLGAAVIVNLLTSQADTLLVASILHPTALGIFGTASTLQNGTITLATAPAAPFAYRSVKTSLNGDPDGGRRLLRKATATAAGSAVVIAVLAWGGSLLVGHHIDKLAQVASGDGPLVLGLCLASAPVGVISMVWLYLGIGFGRHRAVGLSQIGLGVFAAGAIIAGALVAGVVGAATGVVARDVTRVAFLRRLKKPPPKASQALSPARPVATPA
jgi:O-antigen/teichoic acid export membrane protein